MAFKKTTQAEKFEPLKVEDIVRDPAKEAEKFASKPKLSQVTKP